MQILTGYSIDEHVVGVYDPAFLPINRGFDSSTGFLWDSEDHFTENLAIH